MDALFNVYKPKGPTSHDVVARVRRAGGVKRVGHAGTLDPLAEGVLVVACGQATRLVEYLAGLDKAYRAQVTFGVETTTYDAEGEVVQERPIDDLPASRIEAVLAAFRGPIQQRPPAYSAVSVGGKRLHELARRGEVAEAPLRSVEITRLDLLAWAPPVATLDVECTKGTYVRSLAHDLGQALGCGAHLSGLVRLRVGGFLAHNAVPLSDLEQRLRDGRWQAIALPPDAAVAHLPRVALDAGSAARLAHGLAVAAGAGVPPVPPDVQPGDLGRAYGPDGEFLAIVRLGRLVRQESSGYDLLVWRPEKVFRRAA